MKFKFRRIFRMIGHHALILAKGFTRMLYGASAAALLAVGIYGYCAVPSEGGYAAVFDFLGSICITVISLTAIYVMGGKGKKGAKQ